MAEFTLTLADAKALKGSPLSQPANLDALRQADVTGQAGAKKAQGIDSRVHLIGRSRLNLTETAGQSTLRDLAPFIDDKAATVTSSTRQLSLDYGNRLLRLDSPRAQGLVGNLNAAGTAELSQLRVSSALELGAIVVVSLDGKALNSSARMLLQIMTEERPSNFAEEPAGEARFRITRLGTDPWLIRAPNGTITLKRPDAGQLKVTPLDANGYPQANPTSAEVIGLRPDAVYYLIEK